MSDLDTAYDARGTVAAATFEEVMAAYRSRSEESVAGLVGHAGIGYDTDSDERLDVWGVRPGELRPVVLAVHGGYWRMLSRSDTAFMAAPLAAAGVATVAVDYSLAPAATLEEMVRQVRTSVAWIHRHGADHGLDARRIVVCGSSAGAHLAAMTMVGGWQDRWDLPEAAVGGALLISGLFDLRPLLHTAVNEWIALDEHRAAALSPALAPVSRTPVVVARAEVEAAGFVQQSEDFQRRWAASAPAKRRVVADRNHFDVFLDLADPTSVLFTDLLELVGDC